jgi:hypothetical protein
MPGTTVAKRHDDKLNCVLTRSRLPSPAPEILDYLARQPKAQDTIDGILRWWVLDSCIRKWEPRIEKTVAALVKRGFLEKKASPSGKVFYHVSTLYLSALQQLPRRQFAVDGLPKLPRRRKRLKRNE